MFLTVHPGGRRETLPAAARIVSAVCATAAPPTTPQLGPDRCERIGPAPQALGLRLWHAGRVYLTLLPCRAQPGEELLQRRRGRPRRVAEGGCVGNLDELLLGRPDLLQQTNRVQRGAQHFHPASHFLARPWSATAADRA